ncbi:hypothetical protein [Cupriavidus taiwanensis]|uniref:hypothetical protein n=1 Tax=Cupriavidus taiwanensis TaxID=164546 RepID=UPI0011C05606|nr:hypothetical protein [Cupriavidus taiwanensis]
MLVKLRQADTEVSGHLVVLGLIFHDPPYVPLAVVWSAKDTFPAVVPLDDCEIVDARLPPDWKIAHVRRGNVVRLAPSDFLEEGFWSCVLNGDETAVTRFNAITEELLRFHALHHV